MTVARLLRLEAIKVRRRTGVQLPIVIFFGFVVLMLGLRIYLGRKSDLGTLAFPGAWREIHESTHDLVTLFAVLTVINIAAAEYGWRTARQNVIDGLSREQFFAAKALTIPVITLLFVLMGYGLSSIIVLATGGLEGEFMPAIFGKAILGLTLGTIGLSSLALFASVAARSIGGALVFVYGYLMLETGIQLILYRLGGVWEKLISYLPRTVLNSLGEITIYDATLRERAMSQRPPWQGELLDPPVLVAVAVIYTAIFLAASYLLIRRRDL